MRYQLVRHFIINQTYCYYLLSNISKIPTRGIRDKGHDNINKCTLQCTFCATDWCRGYCSCYNAYTYEKQPKMDRIAAEYNGRTETMFMVHYSAKVSPHDIFDSPHVNKDHNMKEITFCFVWTICILSCLLSPNATPRNLQNG